MPSPSSPRWIVFDAVGTLLTPRPAVADAYHSAGRRFGSRLTRDEIDRRFKSAFRDSEIRCFPGDRRGRTSEPEESARWRWIVQQVLPDVTDGDACFSELWNHFAEPASWNVYDDVGPTLTALCRSGYQLAMASNFDSRLHRICESFAVLRPIPLRLVSSEVVFRKPAADFYRAILSTCQAAPEEVLVVGDDLGGDVEGPRACGMASIWLDRRGTRNETGVPSIPSLAALAPRLQER
ncbi:MAG: HAD hydrolase-like protein [Planctomycetaceae bacterium]|nr:HAD hydrolase-like protein [Planctomycetaceae bacterium]